MDERNLRLPRQVYGLRALGLTLGFLSVAAVFYERGASPLVWTVLTAHAFLWPHVAWYRARLSADPNRTERANLVVVSVADTGGGIDPAIQARLFHPFQSTKPIGLGLGLSICQSLIEANGGRIGAGPHPAGGAMFFFEVPTAHGATRS